MTNSTGVATRLRVPHYLGDDAKARLPEPAADLIYLLRQERKEAADLIEKLIAALEPFAKLADDYLEHDVNQGDEEYMAGRIVRAGQPEAPIVFFGDFRRARTALQEVQK